MSERKVVPFRKRRPSPAESAIFLQATRNWHPELRRMFFPEYCGPEKSPPKR